MSSRNRETERNRRENGNKEKKIKSQRLPHEVLYKNPPVALCGVQAKSSDTIEGLQGPNKAPVYLSQLISC